ncbi:hypothetical protein G3578_08150 [Brevibacillus sp. SYP-B805]|uniref:hypothetical protein n=1 Tax=Brevibacillus sp. SYP-B805 TaxID=1578199 RepID=UPI0013E9C61B|nr:hypothetical protein [Brevibacillus sp. SYP-B805]NGQ95137.1 hypothetical protein [Brevibacillus sp. SYP-B805]
MSGFKFNRTARAFFQAYYGVKRFSLTKEMAAALREAEKRRDYEMTVADLIEVYERSRRPSGNESLPAPPRLGQSPGKRSRMSKNGPPASTLCRQPGCRHPAMKLTVPLG